MVIETKLISLTWILSHLYADTFKKFRTPWLILVLLALPQKT